MMTFYNCVTRRSDLILLRRQFRSITMGGADTARQIVSTLRHSLTLLDTTSDEQSQQAPGSHFLSFRFSSFDKRMEVWSKRQTAKKNNLHMEEWLTGWRILQVSVGSFYVFQGYREKLYIRCRHLKKEKFLSDVFTECGDVTVVFQSEDGEKQTKIVTSEKELDKIEAELKALKELS